MDWTFWSKTAGYIDLDKLLWTSYLMGMACLRCTHRIEILHINITPISIYNDS